MSTKIMFKMTIDEAKEELVANERMQEAIAEKFNWPELTDKEYIAAELRLSECQAEEDVLRSTALKLTWTLFIQLKSKS